jgi:hypothetical protein
VNKFVQTPLEAQKLLGLLAGTLFNPGGGSSVDESSRFAVGFARKARQDLEPSKGMKISVDHLWAYTSDCGGREIGPLDLVADRKTGHPGGDNVD